MRIAFVGDIHCRLNRMYEKVQLYAPMDMIFQIGDFGTFLDRVRLDRATIRHDGFIPDFKEYYEGTLETSVQTYFIKGNHEDFDFLEAHEKDNGVAKNIIYLPNKSIIKPADGVKIGALGGCWSWLYYAEGRAKKGKDKRKYFSKDDVEFFKTHPVDILLLHDCPQGVMGEVRGSPRLTELIEEVQPRYAFHGHHHRYNCARIGRTEVIGLGIITKEKEKFIHVIEL